MTATKMRVRFARGTGGSMHMTTVPEYLRRTFTQGQWSAECPLCPAGGCPTQYRPSFRVALDYADEHARGHFGHTDIRPVRAALDRALGDNWYVTYGFRTHPYRASVIHLERDSDEVALWLVTESIATVHPDAVPGWSWAGRTEPLRDRAGQPLGCDATPDQVADAVLAALIGGRS